MNDIRTGSDTLADELLRAYDEGKSIDELNEMLGAEETENEEGLPFAEDEEESGEAAEEEEESGEAAEEEEESGEAAEEEEESGEAAEEEKNKIGDASEKPYRTYSTQEDFQKDFNKRFNYRFRKEKDAHDAAKKEFDDFKSQVASLLGVAPEKVLDELSDRQLKMRAEETGEDFQALAEKTRTERELLALRREVEEAKRRESVGRAISDIKAQGEELKKSFPAFDLDEAMEDEGFRSTCFSLYNLSPENAVKRAFLACEGLGKFKNESAREPRVSEGAARPNENSAVKKVNVGSLSDKEILDYEKRILSGENVQF